MVWGDQTVPLVFPSAGHLIRRRGEVVGGRALSKSLRLLDLLAVKPVAIFVYVSVGIF